MKHTNEIESTQIRDHFPTFSIASTEFPLIRAEDGFFYLHFGSICRRLGLNEYEHTQYINQHPVLKVGFITREDQDERMNFIRIDFLALWLVGLNLTGVDPFIKQEISEYQHEAAPVLLESWLEGRLTAKFYQLLKKDTPLVKAYKEAIAVTAIARSLVLDEANSQEEVYYLQDIPDSGSEEH